MSDERTYPERPDLDGVRHFYASLFGWTFTDAVPAEAQGTYLIAALENKDVAAIGPAPW